MIYLLQLQCCDILNLNLDLQRQRSILFLKLGAQLHLANFALPLDARVGI